MSKLEILDTTKTFEISDGEGDEIWLFEVTYMLEGSEAVYSTSVMGSDELDAYVNIRKALEERYGLDKTA